MAAAQRIPQPPSQDSQLQRHRFHFTPLSSVVTSGLSTQIFRSDHSVLPEHSPGQSLLLQLHYVTTALRNSRFHCFSILTAHPPRVLMLQTSAEANDQVPGDRQGRGQIINVRHGDQPCAPLTVHPVLWKNQLMVASPKSSISTYH